MLYGGAVSYVFLCTLPGLRLLTNQVSRFYFHFGYSDFVYHMLLVAAAALPVAAVFGFVIKPRGRLLPLQRLSVAALVALVLPIYLQLGANQAGWFYVSAGLESRFATIVFLGVMAPVVASTRVFEWTVRGAKVLLKLFSPLPVVMAIYFLGVPGTPSVRAPEPSELNTATSGAPVYIVLFDALDRNRVFAPDNRSRFPTLFGMKEQATWFSDVSTPGYGTIVVIPNLLHQTKSEVTRDDNGDYLLDGTPSTEHDSILTQLRTDDSVCVVGGFHLSYSKLLGGKIDWLQEYSYYNANQSLPGVIKTNAQLVLANPYVPSNPAFKFLRSAASTSTFADDHSDYILTQLEAQLLSCASAKNHNIVAFFHLPLPHVPFMYGRDGRRLQQPDPAENDEEAYLKNAEYVDTVVDRLVHALEESGQWPNATLVITGDHGKEYSEQPPLLVKLPGQSQGRVESSPLYTSSLLDWLYAQPAFSDLHAKR